MGETLRFKYQTSRSRTKRGNTEVQKLSWFPLSKSVPVLWKGANLEKAMQADDSDGNDSSPPSSPTAESGSQRCVACPVLISRDWPRRLWPTCVSGGLACHGRSNHLVGGNIMSLLTGGEHAKSCSWGWSQSLPHRVQFQNTRGGVKVMKFWIVRLLKTLIFGRSKNLKNSSKILANTFADSLAILQKNSCW